MSSGTRSRWAGTHEAAAAILVQLVFMAAFLWTPISRYHEVHYSAADLTQGMSLTRIEPGHRPGNQLQSDAITQMQPWVLFNREELSHGRFPLWNPLNAAGAPHFANYQSAVLSPFSVPFYVMDFKPALLVSAALKLLVLGLFTYLFLREIGCGWLAATVGGVAFQFAGHNALLLYFPHVGAMCALPAGLYFAERALRRAADALAEGRKARLFPALSGLTASLVLGLLAGNPEPFYFACWGIGAWIVARLVGLWREHRRSAAARRELGSTTGKIALSLALAMGLAAFQVLPFLDYLQQSRVLEQRSLRQTPLEMRWWPLQFFPDALGNPSSTYRISDTIPPPNYELVNMSYVGGVALLLAALAPFVARGRRGRIFFPALAVGWFVYAHDVFGAYDLFALIPTLDMAPMNRSQGLWNFAIAAAAAVALDGLLHRDARRAWFAAAWWWVASGIVLVACLIGADRIVDSFQDVPSPFHRWFLRAVPPHFEAMCLWTLAGVAAVSLCFLVRQRLARQAFGLVIGLAVFAQTGWLLRDYNPVSPDPFVFPRTAAVTALKAAIGDERVAILGRDGLPPDSNLVYGIAQLASYDGMWMRDLDHLYRDHFGDGDNWRPIVRGSHRSLRLFGTRYVLAKWGWIFLDSGLRDFGKNTALQPQRVELLPRRGATQTFHCYDEELSTVMVMLSTPQNVRDCTLAFRLEDAATGEVIAEQTISSREVQANVYSQKQVAFPGDWNLNPAGRPVVFRFPALKGSKGRDFRIRLQCEDGRGGDTIYAWHMPVLAYGLGVAHHADRKLPGELLFDWSCGENDRFETVAQVGDFTLYRLREPAAVYSLVDSAVIAKSDQDGFELVRSWSFDPRKLVVLGVGDEETARTVGDAAAEARKRRIVQFSDSPFCYLVSKDGKRLAHIDDEATFLAHRFAWNQIQRVDASERAKYVIVPDDDVAGRLEVGLHVIQVPTTHTDVPEILEETPTRIRLRVSRKVPGYLVAANAYDAGWKATLSGTDVPVLRANYAFQAVEVPPGSWEIELRYRPDSLVRGLWIGALSLVVAAAAGLASRRAARRAVAA